MKNANAPRIMDRASTGQCRQRHRWRGAEQAGERFGFQDIAQNGKGAHHHSSEDYP
jgi:hypothetical protein